MLLSIVKYPDPILKVKCTPVLEVTDELRELAQNMIDTMYAAPGVGLAAPQVGETIRMLVMDPGGQTDLRRPRVLINPVLECSGTKIKSEREGCLSVPMDYRADVERFSHVHLRARDLDWQIIDEELDGFPAIIVQHEADHLDGVLFIDHISRMRRSFYEKKVKKWMRMQENA